MMEWVYALIAALITALSGVPPLLYKKKIQTRYWIALAAGVLVSTAFFEMLPEVGGYIYLGAIGFFAIYLLEKVLMIHACGEEECKTHKITWTALLSTSIDNLVDGMVIATATVANVGLGLLVTLAVIIHESVQTITATVIMKDRKYKIEKIIFTLSVFALTILIGAFFAQTFLEEYYKPMIALASGVFLYVGASDMLPEAHKKFNWKVIIALLFGALLVAGIGFFLH